MNHQIIIGDGISELSRIPDGSVDMVLADLPYGTTRAPNDNPLDLHQLWPEYLRVCKDNGAILLFAQSPFDKILAASNLSMYRYEWIWEKTSATGHLNSKKMPLKAHENILVFYRRLPTYNPQKTTGHKRKVSTAHHKRNSKVTPNYGEFGLTDYDSTERYPRSVIKGPSDKQKSKYHHQQKPVWLLKYFINTYTDPGQTVLDNTCGSGSMGVAAEITGRNSILIDNDPQWEATINKRLIELT